MILKNTNSSTFTRRRLLQNACTGVAVACAAPAIFSQDGLGKAPSVFQMVDDSLAQRDVSRDFVVGSRTAWQEINAKGGLRGKTIRHQVVLTDGSKGQAQAAWLQAQQESNCLATFGSCGNDIAKWVALAAKQSANTPHELAHIAPWLQSDIGEFAQTTFPIFANRELQIQHVLHSLSGQGTHHLHVVYTSEQEQLANSEDLRRIALKLKLTLKEMPLQADLAQQALQMSEQQVPLVLFMGGTPELIQLMRGWRVSKSLRYIIALADVNLQTASQLNANKFVPVIGTQTVPMVTSHIPIVRRYRAALSKYFDEPPTALSLSGYLSAQYTAQMLQSAQQLTRASVTQALFKRRSVDLDGFRIAIQEGKLLSAYVTQSMQTADGRVIG